MENLISISIEGRNQKEIDSLSADINKIKHDDIQSIFIKKEDKTKSLDVFCAGLVLGLATNFSYDLLKYLFFQIKKSLKKSKAKNITVKIQGIDININSDEEISPELVKQILDVISKKDEW